MAKRQPARKTRAVKRARLRLFWGNEDLGAIGPAPIPRPKGLPVVISFLPAPRLRKVKR